MQTSYLKYRPFEWRS